jgi:Domain of unknown function (DUF4114)/Secretion system C-terminal sorting domain
MQSNLQLKKALPIIALLIVQLCFAQNTTFQYLGTFNSSGRPNYLVTPGDVVPADMMARINNSLPENYPVPTYHPEYLSTGVQSDIVVTALSEVWITFVDEGAGYQNTLAFYTYNTATPPTTKPTTLQVAFPNLSKDNNILVKGDKVLLGRFPAGTSIGFAIIANGFQNGGVTKGYATFYSNPNFNPETTAALRKHSVLLNDATGAKIIGFEDLDRGSSGCDNDFNDAVFYATASVVTPCVTCPSTVGTGSGVGSGNSGGLESDGCLASAIAGRNFQRAKTSALSYDNPDVMQQFTASTGNLAVRNDVELEQFVPEQPFYAQPVTAYISTPKDLLGVTNAQKVLSVDYFDDATKERLAAVLTTKTANKVYDHTKVICDRLTGSTLLRTEKIQIDNIPFIRSTLVREDGKFEYAICFSMSKESSTNATITSRWAIDEYLVSQSYYNYQVWAEAPHLAQRVVEEILIKLKAQYTLSSTEGENLPQLFVKKGSYDNGLLTLSIYNPIEAKSLTINGNSTYTETGERIDFTKKIALTGKVEETIQVNVGTVFDMGFTIRNDVSNDYDALYFADGAWGLEYDKTKTSVSKYTVAMTSPVLINDIFTVERNPTIKGQTTDYISLFRSLRPAGVAANISKFTNLSFVGYGEGVAEIVLMKASIKDWSKQYRAEVSLFDEKQQYNLPLSIFSNGTGETLKADDITHIVVTLNNNTKETKYFEIGLDNVQFNNKKGVTISNKESLTAYPNPATTQTTIAFNMSERSMAFFSLSNAQGQTMMENKGEFAKGTTYMPLDLAGLPSGIYVATVTTATSKMMTKVLIP